MAHFLPPPVGNGDYLKGFRRSTVLTADLMVTVYVHTQGTEEILEATKANSTEFGCL